MVRPAYLIAPSLLKSTFVDGGMAPFVDGALPYSHCSLFSLDINKKCASLDKAYRLQIRTAYGMGDVIRSYALDFYPGRFTGKIMTTMNAAMLNFYAHKREHPVADMGC